MRYLTLLVLSSLFLTGCGATRGIAKDFRPALTNAMNCADSLHFSDFSDKPNNAVFFELVGEDKKCIIVNGKKSFYKAVRTNVKIGSVLVRSFYATSGDKARLFAPKVYSYDLANKVMNDGIIDYIDDLSTSKDGHFLEIKYVFNQPVNQIVIVSDGFFDEEGYEYNQRNIGGFYSGGAIFEYDFVSQHNIAVNAGGPLEVIINPSEKD